MRARIWYYKKETAIAIFALWALISFTANYRQIQLYVGEKSASETLADMLMVQNEFKSRKLLDVDKDGEGEYASLSQLLQSGIVLKNVAWDS